MREAVKTVRPSVAFLQQDAKHDAIVSLARELVADRAGDRRQMPIVVIADREYPAGEDAGISEWLIAPFSAAYAQAKVESWALRGMSHWMKAALPDNEALRLATLKSAGLLDTPADARFDRITRLASRFFEVPSPSPHSSIRIGSGLNRASASTSRKRHANRRSARTSWHKAPRWS